MKQNVGNMWKSMHHSQSTTLVGLRIRDEFFIEYRYFLNRNMVKYRENLSKAKQRLRINPHKMEVP